MLRAESVTVTEPLASSAESSSTGMEMEADPALAWTDTDFPAPRFADESHSPLWVTV